ncbi:hypothetical protein [Methylobacterium sp. J-090]|uniref:hypothetical protein n=1 Tax=Methylobacterium sp. J-090 TaxID=2836666 RepID=UPI001FB90E61|nr:hypothetical protein [Methylobacterium sp. J-090]MCJ2082819.1 hypothetical protein [Methylobacterium sp. J-090]
MVLDQAEDASLFPQVGLDSSTETFQSVYWRCIVCFFATSTRQNPTARHVLFTTAVRLPELDGLDLADFFAEVGVEVVVLPITHRLGSDRVKAWNNVFYILDIIAYLHRIDKFDRVVVMDSDCLWVRPADGLMSDIGRQGVLSMSIPYAYDEKLNGASRRDMVRAGRLLAGQDFQFVPNFSGGELFAATRAGIFDVHRVCAGMWQRLISVPPGEVAVYTEEHLLSLAYAILNVPTGTGDPHIRRMWTALRLNNVTAEDVDSGRCAWHLPMEKKTGFVDLYALIRDRTSWFWSLPPEDLRLRLAGVMGIPRRSPRQWMKQVGSRLKFIVSKRLSFRHDQTLSGKLPSHKNGNNTEEAIPETGVIAGSEAAPPIGDR